MRLRAHHLCCSRFWEEPAEERGPAFKRARDDIRQALLSRPEAMIVAVEGADELCQACPLCVGGRCASPRGDEDRVRKWDAILLKELGLPAGTCLASGRWRELIERKTPFKLCQRCQWKKVCSVGAILL